MKALNKEDIFKLLKQNKEKLKNYNDKGNKTKQSRKFRRAH